MSLSLKNLRLLSLCCCLILFLGYASANTEIINFHTKRGQEDARAARAFYPALHLDGTLKPKVPLRWESNLNKTETLEFGLLLDEHAGKSRRGSWTVRISWPATMPSDFKLEIVPWKSSRTDLTSSSHDRLLRLTRWPTGIIIPEGTPLTSWTSTLSSTSSSSSLVQEQDKIVFDILVEPLSFGVIPSTAWPTIGSVVIMAIGGFFFATRFVFPLWIDPLFTKGRKAE